MFSKGPNLKRVLPVAAIGAILAISVAVAPSIAGSSFLTRQKAANVYLKQKEAHRLFLTNKESHSFYKKKTVDDKFLKQGVAKQTYVAKADQPEFPVAAVASSTADFSVISTTPVVLPTSPTTFTVPATSLVTLTFSGQATCTAGTNGVGCPIDILVDGATTGKVNFLTATSATPQAKAAVHTFSTTSVLTAGKHVAGVQYSGATDPTLKFAMTDWNFAVTAFPEPAED